MATRKQKAVVKAMVENVGISTGKAMALAGYSPAMVKNPQKMTSSIAFAELAERYLPSDRLLEVATKGLEADKVTRFKDGTEFTDPDYYARHQYLETALRIRNLISGDVSGDINIQVINYAEPESKPKTVKIKRGREGIPPVKGKPVSDNLSVTPTPPPPTPIIPLIQEES